jgi:GNAT superfamily N-acetyltransferase
MSDRKISIVPLTVEKINLVLEVQRDCYPLEYVESEETFNKIINVYPKSCLGICVHGFIGGYVFFHPYYEDKIKPLNFNLTLDGTEDCIYIHDLAVSSKYRGLGLTKLMMDKVDCETKKDGFTLQCLVAVQESKDFWERGGFRIVYKLEKYGLGPAYYMKRSI